MTTSGSGPEGSYPELADGLRAATEAAAELWRAGADALAAQAAALQRFTLSENPGVDRYFELLRNASEANQQLAGQWAAAVRSMTQVLLPVAGAPDPVGGSDPGPSEAGAAPATTTDAEPAPAAATSAEVMVPEPDAPLVAAAEGSAGAPDPRPTEVVPAGPTDVATLPGKTPAKPRRTGAAAPDAVDPDPTDPRTAYVRLGKAAISARLAARGLPRTGTLAQLVNRLVEAETAD